MFDGILHETHFKILQPSPPLPYCMCALLLFALESSMERRVGGGMPNDEEKSKHPSHPLYHTLQEIPFGGAASHLTAKLAVTLAKNFRVHRFLFFCLA